VVVSADEPVDVTLQAYHVGKHGHVVNADASLLHGMGWQTRERGCSKQDAHMCIGALVRLATKMAKDHSVRNTFGV